MNINELKQKTQSELDATVKKLQQLAQITDQLIAQQNKLVGKLEAYDELLKDENEGKEPSSEEETNDKELSENEKNDNNQ